MLGDKRFFYRTLSITTMPTNNLPKLLASGNKWEVNRDSQTAVKEHVEEDTVEGRDRCVDGEPGRNSDKEAIPCPPLAPAKRVPSQKNNENTPSSHRGSEDTIDPGLELLRAGRNRLFRPENRIDMPIEGQLVEPGLAEDGKDQAESNKNPADHEEPAIPEIEP
nr:putative integron gene cassette protein [uncultured bacterium]